ncbi:MAG: hypothetical protein COY66_05095 [Candidatus Kerfeldbacteria bacterium CG_4_10_14_0_8_um_filter_42_10]|uniref:Uncharacterized protein n=1 Tax=Candidatus Kerfeldbacteria bacterium CG_4_10_14_0_8_um_filter_42_10 TaxID=2014248 RepID=A0A2M7RHX7_9BACT|nr:MAG: hypothetical protein COY66_05095 [Candidatus Kerfeldbacteria bacterium CG_4_10_14_0_8_um_filter_42_10]
MFNLFKRIFMPQDPEAFIAYLSKLPSSIQVKWIRDGKFIIGWISADDNEFMTQGKNAEEFIEMVNDAVYTAYEIPDNYVTVINKYKAYKPPIEEMKKLKDGSVSKANFNAKKEVAIA